MLVAPQLTPSEAAALDLRNIRGFCVDEGGHTGHTAIIARSLGVPAVVGLKNASRVIRSGDELAVDGARGEVHIKPDESTLRRFQVRIVRRKQAEDRLLTMREAPAETTDGHRIELSANVSVKNTTSSTPSRRYDCPRAAMSTGCLSNRNRIDEIS